MNIAIIPARGGSKRIPRKNIKFFHGRPMIYYSIKVAQESKLFDHIIVSTDDDEIANIAASYGAEVPFKRPNNLASDTTPTVPVMSHAVQACNELGLHADFFCCIYPCSPFILKSDFVAGLEEIKKKRADFVYPVTEFSHPIQRSMFRSEKGEMEFLYPEYELTRTQDLPVTYHDAGQFYWGKKNAWLGMKRMHSEGVGLVIPNWRVIDIDNYDDWKRAELMYVNIEKH
ncbi:pseudaminic acid cytidylyltransferase [Halomonas sp. IOP_14]|uniref:pseudaminic acid cytidylyltransferase n=1 Tax=Halomonas sp. IOP_14 TaxID=2873295 RepID=UPI001E431E69|nr:pseudaminic acid cytidylyltransferase [Halomonas sp. IOP_14]MCD1588406.1 pseudaminic acid cytidylyltransferase [Halomonas sp. IOP_14]|tara:strand:- start:562 stop:1248 length:687 start_codon:yes stop_codon:yes gene_type:complete